METIAVTLEKTVSIWWSAVWRMILLVAIAAVVLGGTVGLIVALMGKAELAGKVGEVLGPICALPLSIWAFKGALSKKHGGYTVVLVTEGSTKAIRVTLEKAISIWWAALWRLFLSAAGLGVGAALVIPLLGKPQLDVPAGVMFGAIWLCLILLSIWALRRSLSRQDGGYSVVLGKAA